MRLASLDSVRGCAALVVVLHHASFAIWETQPNWIAYSPVRLLLAGPAAVLVFFVLSGVVLAMTFVHRDGERYLPYIVKRITRIWLPFAVVIILSAALRIGLGGLPAVGTPWMLAGTWSEPLSWQLVGEHLLMTGRSTDLDNPMWSLIQELRISIIFPALVALTVRNGPIAMALSLVALVLGVKASTASGMASLASALAYLFLFVMGILISIHVRAVRSKLGGLAPAWHVGLWVVALAALLACPERTYVLSRLLDGIRLVIAGSGAALIVMLSITEGKVLSALLGPVPAFLGRISYSLYLVHVVVFAVAVRLVGQQIGLAPSIALAVVASFGVALVCHRFIEQPTMQLGRRLAQRISNIPR